MSKLSCLPRCFPKPVCMQALEFDRKTCSETPAGAARPTHHSPKSNSRAARERNVAKRCVKDLFPMLDNSRPEARGSVSRRRRSPGRPSRGFFARACGCNQPGSCGGPRRRWPSRLLARSKRSLKRPSGSPSLDRAHHELDPRSALRNGHRRAKLCVVFFGTRI